MFNKDTLTKIYAGQPTALNNALQCYDAIYNAFKTINCPCCGSIPTEVNPLIMAVALAQVRTEVGKNFLPIREIITPEQANKNYGGRYGNTAPNSGYLYRGAGYLQITFKDNWDKYGLTLENCDTVESSAKALALYFYDKKIHLYAMQKDFLKCRILVNGINPKTGLPNGYDTYTTVLNQYLA